MQRRGLEILPPLVQGRRLEDTTLFSREGGWKIHPYIAQGSNASLLLPSISLGTKRTRLLTSISHVINFTGKIGVYLPSFIATHNTNISFSFLPPTKSILSPSFTHRRITVTFLPNHCDFFAKKSSLNILSKILCRERYTR